MTGNKIPILCNQENFMLRDNAYKLKQALPEYHLLINPAIKQDLSSGRPSNGMFIALPRIIKNHVTDVSPGFWRVQAVKIGFKSSSVLLINSYFPTDPQRAGADHSELLETLTFIKKVIEQNSSSAILWAGDINSEFARNSDHTLAVQDALYDLGLHVAWDNFDADFSCSHELLGQTYTSLLDHFFWNNLFSQSVTDAGVLHLPGNMSDHQPIYCTFNSDLIEEQLQQPNNTKPRPSWSRASSEEKYVYKANLEQGLADLYIPYSVTHCQDLHCQDTSHKEELDHYAIAVLDIIQGAAEVSLPTPTSKDVRRKPAIPGWFEEVKPFRDDAFFWHQIWKSCGRPMNTELHKVMKHSRNTYHYQFRKCKKA